MSLSAQVQIYALRHPNMPVIMIATGYVRMLKFKSHFLRSFVSCILLSQLALGNALGDAAISTYGNLQGGGAIGGQIQQAPGQQQEINDAIKLLKESRTALTVATAGWTADLAICGFNCYTYESVLMANQKAVVGTSAELYKAIVANGAGSGAACAVLTAGSSAAAVAAAVLDAADSEGTIVAATAKSTATDAVSAFVKVANSIPGEGTIAANITARTGAQVPTNELIAAQATKLIADAGVVLAACPANGAAWASLTGLSSALTTLNATFTANITKVVGTANYCDYAGIASGLVDVAAAKMLNSHGNQYASQLPQVSATNVVGLVAPLASLGLESLLAVSAGSGPATNADVAGVSSCAMAGVAGFELITDISQTNTVQNGINDDNTILNNLNNNGGTSSMLFPKSNLDKSFWTQARFLTAVKLSEKWGKWISNQLVLDAYAATDSKLSKFSACEGPNGMPSDYQTCVGNADPLLAKVLQRSPGGFDGFFNKFAEITGSSKNLGMSNINPPSLSQAAEMAFGHNPFFKGKFMAVMGDMQNKYYAEKGENKFNLGVLVKTAPMTPGATVSGGSKGVSAISFEGPLNGIGDGTGDKAAPSLLAPSSGSTTAAFAPRSAGPTRDPAAAENPNINLFDRVTSRYQTVLDRLDPTKQALTDWGKAPQQTATN